MINQLKKKKAIQAIDTRNLTKKVDYNTQFAKIENKILEQDQSKCITQFNFDCNTMMTRILIIRILADTQKQVLYF